MSAHSTQKQLTVGRPSFIALPRFFIFAYPLILIITSHSLWRVSSDEWDRRCRNKRSLASSGALFSILKDTLLGMTSSISSFLAIARASMHDRNLSLYFLIIAPHWGSVEDSGNGEIIHCRILNTIILHSHV